MKINIAVSALFTAAALLTPAHASSVLFTASATLPTSGAVNSPATVSLTNGAGSIAAYGFDGVFSTQAAPSTVSVNSGNPDSPKNGVGEQIDYSSNGMGLKSNDAPYIGPTDGIVLDFSNVKSSVVYNGQTGTEADVNFALKIDATGPSDWTIYGFNGTTYTLLASGPMQPGTGYTATPMFTTTTLYSDNQVVVTNDCALTITALSIDYTKGTTTQQTPEPGTFVMAGMALIGLGVTMKKRSAKA